MKHFKLKDYILNGSFPVFRRLNPVLQTENRGKTGNSYVQVAANREIGLFDTSEEKQKNYKHCKLIVQEDQTFWVMMD